jgi:hypothetical protein
MYDKEIWHTHGRAPYKDGAGGGSGEGGGAASGAATRCTTASCPEASCSDHACCCCANLGRCYWACAGNPKPMPATISMRGCAAGVAAAGWGTGGHRGAAAAASLASSGSRTRQVALDIAPSVWLNSASATGGRLAVLSCSRCSNSARYASAGRRPQRRALRLVLHIAVAPGARPRPGPPTRAPTLPLRLQPEPGVAEVVVYPHQGVLALTAALAPGAPATACARRCLMAALVRLSSKAVTDATSARQLCAAMQWVEVRVGWGGL